MRRLDVRRYAGSRRLCGGRGCGIRNLTHFIEGQEGGADVIAGREGGQALHSDADEA